MKTISSIKIIAGILLIISLIGIYKGLSIHSDFNYEPLGPRAFPIGILILISFFSLFLIFISKNNGLKWGDFIFWKKFIILTLALLLYAIFFELLGFMLCTFLLIFIMTLLFKTTLPKACIFSILSSIILYYFFDNVLQITLPFGFIFNHFN
ncbi:tripartite tricarboxylate transporter TctB family protein [Campylobacter hepaticus]|uniref:tripartite tricarboxylate transporter TctB family protein n=1 Tax=Campylobacter hepaticus TaxID=1813019 RepID=UPI00082C3CA7|nr:tripartite tricarboxylate transporter TctB family protein [Campylobacter hepaticus]MCZ0772831.1 tripartite tricarboxylate transporter TctB family protein [Campylobacter hepaticus]MCZ0774300.1 tripartite tricarboxylate transporter TctB family protein [Campylobacter hepaticus]MCZ0775552.1 tripartite tricarboxylate transporter TctB family protein [Campylobacter hepaticus]MDX2323165.1 tripartite tricarboxylate transporter TctB family protein [Campylobacter hepaticus]MDX2331013.1 tripartite tric